MTDALKRIEFTVDGNNYATYQLDAIEGRKLFLRVVKAVAPALDKLPGKTAKAEDAEAKVMVAVAGVLSELDDSLLELLCEKFGAKTVHKVSEGRELTLDKGYFGLHFAARYVAMTQWLFECCKANGLFDFLPKS